ncbi:hypothetical protein [Kitasatospora sp. NPDC051914]|uniref:fascin domain-containing protein n=1 Tax=Kitasatospora sp. NPDC051914 TaxID=3154945 RepID=UPI003433DF22
MPTAPAHAGPECEWGICGQIINNTANPGAVVRALRSWCLDDLQVSLESSSVKLPADRDGDGNRDDKCGPAGDTWDDIQDLAPGGATDNNVDWDGFRVDQGCKAETDAGTYDNTDLLGDLWAKVDANADRDINKVTCASALPAVSDSRCAHTGTNFAGTGVFSTTAANGELVSSEDRLDAPGALRARTDSSNTSGFWEQFRFEVVDPNCSVYAIWSVNKGSYVTAEASWRGGTSGALRARMKPTQTTTIGAWEKFTLHDLGGGNFALRSWANGRYVSAELGYPGDRHALLRARATSIGPWETFHKSSTSQFASYCEEPAGDPDTTYCQVRTNGASGTGATGTTGTTYAWFDWSGRSSGRWTSVSGSVCVTDTWANGRGVKAQIDVHKAGAGTTVNTTNYVIRGPYKDTGGSCSSWYTFTASNSGGIDFVYIEWGDTWSNCSYCYMGRYKLTVL